MSAHKAVSWMFLIVVLALCAISIGSMQYNEDISAFLPQNEQTKRYSSIYSKLGGQNRIAVFFRGNDRDSVICAMDRFAEVWRQKDSLNLVNDIQVTVDDEAVDDVVSFIRENIPYFLDEKDYLRIDSLLSTPGYIEERLASAKLMLLFPSSSFVSDYISYDPLDLFYPVYNKLFTLNGADQQNLITDGYIFVEQGKTGVVFMTSPFGDSESGNNGLIVNLIDTVISSIEKEMPTVKVSSVGGPIIAVANSTRIKKDSFLAIVISIVLIFLVLILSFRSWRELFQIGFSILCGSIFALGLISTFKSEISLIILGIGSIIIGIAVNYPLHYIDHLKHQPDRRAALKDIISPLLTGNITTVFAFLSLYILKADALHDFGLTGALVLVGTILFVLIFLPSLMGSSHTVKKPILHFGKHIPDDISSKLFIPFVIITCILGFFSTKSEFDADLNNINYMTQEQKADLAVLSSMSENAGDTKLWLVTEAPDADSAFIANETVLSRLEIDYPISSISTLVPSVSKQKQRIEDWNNFLAKYPNISELTHKKAVEAGFTNSAFTNFDDILQADYPIRNAQWFKPLLQTVGQTSYLEGLDGSPSLVNYISVPSSDSDSVKTYIKNVIDSVNEACVHADSFIFDSSDVSGQLASLLSEDFNSVGIVCGFIVFFFLWLSFGRIELSLMAFLPLAISWLWILGIMHLTGIQFNIVNIILATFIFGQGDDYTIFITEGLMYEYAYGRKILTSYRNSVFLSAIIMFIGIGSLIVAGHPAMKSLAEVTVIGMFTVVIMAFYLPPLVFKPLIYKNGVRRQMPITLARIGRSLFAVIFFLVAILIIVPLTQLYFIGKNHSELKKFRYHKFLQKLAKFIMYHIPGTEFHMENRSGENFSKPAVIICNHQSHLDVMCLMMMSPKIVILTNDWVWNNIFYRGIIRHAEFYPVSDGMDTNLERLKGLVSRGYSVVVFPEGTRSIDCSIGRFRKGAFVIARELGVDILPIFLHGVGHVLPKKELMLRPGRIDVQICNRISPETMGSDDKTITKAFRRYYIEQYGLMSSKLETASYFKELVRYSYIYKGKEIEHSANKELTSADLSTIDNCKSGTSIYLNNSNTGAYALLFAITRKDVNVVFTCKDADVVDLLSQSPLKPENLIIQRQ